MSEVLTEEQKIATIINPILEKHNVLAYNMSEELLEDLMNAMGEYGRRRYSEGAMSISSLYRL